MLIRSFQKANPRGHLDERSVITSYCAHVRSTMEYCSVIWSGAAPSHVIRLERLEHRFLLWLNAHVRYKSTSLLYHDLLSHFRLVSVSARRSYHDIMFLRNIFAGRIDSSFLLQCFSLNAPSRTTRQQALFAIPYARVSTVREGLFVRLPRLANKFIEKCSDADLLTDTLASFRSQLRAYICTL